MVTMPQNLVNTMRKLYFLLGNTLLWEKRGAENASATIARLQPIDGLNDSPRFSTRAGAANPEEAKDGFDASGC